MTAHKEKNYEKLIPILLFALMFTGCAGVGNQANNTYRRITMDEAVNMMAEESGYIILDVRSPDEFAAGQLAASGRIARVYPNFMTVHINT